MPLAITDLHVSVEHTPVVRGVSLSLERGALHVLMGPNGSGKSTLAHALMGHPSYKITNGNIAVDGVDVTEEDADVRAQHGLFLSFQYPVEISGVSVQNFLRTAYNAIHKTEVDVLKFHDTLKKEMDVLGIDAAFAKRSLNEGFSGGEKKRLEMLQLAVLKPAYALLDETDSGLDVDALKVVAQTIAHAKKQNTGILLITHYSRILEYIDVDAVHIMTKGKIRETGTRDLVDVIEKNGYASLSA